MSQDAPSFLGTLIDWGVCVFLIVYVCFRLDATNKLTGCELVFVGGFWSRRFSDSGRFGLQQDPTAAD
jgi:hypothetical protein